MLPNPKIVLFLCSERKIAGLLREIDFNCDSVPSGIRYTLVIPVFAATLVA
jgi:hypothetical protein